MLCEIKSCRCACARGRPSGLLTSPLQSVTDAITVVTPASQSAASTLHDCKYSLRDAFQCVAQPNTTLLDCILYLMQVLYPHGQAFYQALQTSVSLGKCV